MKRKRWIACILLYNFIGLTVAIGGWGWEVLIFLVKEHKFVNRGFLYGPYLPVYGVGAMLLSVLFYYKQQFVMITYARFGAGKYPKKFYCGQIYFQMQALLQQVLKVHSKNDCYTCSDKKIKSAQKPWVENFRIFFLCMFGGSLIEFITGWFFWHVLGCRYWDYRAYLWNIGGYVCLFSAVGFGIFGWIWIKRIAPHLIHIWEKLRFSIQILVIGVSDVFVLIDAVFSLMQPNVGENITFSFYVK